MKMKLKIFFFAVFLPSIVFSQKQLTKEQVLEDYEILKNVMTKAHPSLYEYTSQSEWDELFKNFELEKLQTIQNKGDFYKSITELTDHVRDGHFIVMRPQLASIPKFFPLLLKIIDGKLYTDTDDFGIPLGSEIASIDGIDGEELRKKLMKYAPSDGFNTSKKDRQLEREFGILHFYEFAAKPTYKIIYKTPSNQVFTKNIDSQSFEEIGKRFPTRSSYFSSYHKSENKSEFVKNTLGKKEPFLYFIDSLKTAVLTINAFGLEQARFQSELKDLFKEIKQKKAKQLIIDLRQNEGGYPENANFVFSYIARESFIQPNSQHVITPQIPHKEHSREIMNGDSYESFFEKYFQDASKTENEWVIYAPENEVSMLPAKKGYKGQVYVLVGGRTFSAASSFALNCKNQGIPLIGEETGGGYYFHTGVYPVVYELPHSKIKLMMSLVKIKKYVKDKSVKKGSGVLPDVEIQLSVQDLIEGKDSQLDYVLQLIKKK